MAEGGKIPLLPSLVMRIAAGTNNVIYQAIPCVTDVNGFAAVMKMSEVKSPELADELARFDYECAIPARNRLNKLQSQAPKTYGNLLKQFKKEDDYTDYKEMHFPNSQLYRQMMRPDMGKISGSIDSEEQNVVKNILENGTGNGDELRSEDRVTGIVSDDSDASQIQQANNSGTVACLTWWEDLYERLKTSISDDLSERLVKHQYSFKCIDDDALLSADSATTTNTDYYVNKECLKTIAEQYGDKFYDDLVYIGTTNINESESVALRREDREKAGTIGVLGVVGAVLSIFTGKADVLGSIADSAVGFYAQMFFYRVLLQMLQPMLLMGIFCFWGIFMIIADYRWETILKGLVLIFIISLLPGLWAITQYLDSALWHALYPDVDALSKAMKKQSENYVERLLLDAASTVFNVIFPLILMYLVNEAGGGRPGGAIQAADARAC